MSDGVDFTVKNITRLGQLDCIKTFLDGTQIVPEGMTRSVYREVLGLEVGVKFYYEYGHLIAEGYIK